MMAGVVGAACGLASNVGVVIRDRERPLLSLPPGGAANEIK